MDKEVLTTSGKQWGPSSISPEGLTAIQDVIRIAAQGGFISEQDGLKALKILRTNPHARLSRIGPRLNRLIELVKKVSQWEDHLESLVESTQAEMEDLKEQIAWHPDWTMPGEPGEPGEDRQKDGV